MARGGSEAAPIIVPDGDWDSVINILSIQRLVASLSSVFLLLLVVVLVVVLVLPQTTLRSEQATGEVATEREEFFEMEPSGSWLTGPECEKKLFVVKKARAG